MAERGGAIKRSRTRSRPDCGIDASLAAPHLRSILVAPERQMTIVPPRLALVALFFAPLPAFAQEPPSIVAPEGERFTLTPTEGGFLRMNKETGAVSYCSVKDGVSVCRLGADERVALETEIARLREENARLKAAGTAPPRASGLPSEQDFERALSFTERFLRRIMRLFREEAPSGGGL
jgi:hypothetical protein